MIEINNLTKNNIIVDGSSVIGIKADRWDERVVAEEIYNILQDKGFYADVSINKRNIRENSDAE